MMIIMAVFFYKVASGLVLYFIASSIWGVIERKLLPKKNSSTPPPDSGNGVKRKGRPDKPAPKKRSWLKTKWEELLEAAEKK
jgi:membrane protein insertase Oxa1/YidC/SpoIIIJ